MLYHAQYALRKPWRRSPRPKASRTAGSLFSAQERSFNHPPGFLLCGSESCVRGSKEGGRQVGCTAEFRLGWGGLSFGRRPLVCAQAIVRSFPSFPSRVLNVVRLGLHRCPQLKSIGVGFGALLPSVRSHVRLSSHRSRSSRPT